MAEGIDIVGKLRNLDYRLKKNQELRRLVYIRDDFTCYVCGWVPAYKPTDYNGRYTISTIDNSLNIDHVTPRIRGGTHNVDNLRTICHRCNSRKRDRGVKEVHEHGNI